MSEMSSDDLNVRRKRLIYRANHRGTKELDLMVGGFAQDVVGQMGARDLDAFEQLLDEEEVLLQQFLMGQVDFSAHPLREMIARIRSHQLSRAGLAGGDTV